MTDFFNPAKPGTKRHQIVDKLAANYPAWVARTELATLTSHPSLNVQKLGTSLHLNIETEHREEGVYHRLDPVNPWSHPLGRRVGKLRGFMRMARAERDTAKAQVRDLEARLAAIRDLVAA